MKIKLILTLIIALSGVKIFSQTYNLNIKASDWNFKSQLFYFSEVLDERIDKSKAGSVLLNGRNTKAYFKSSLEEEMKNIILPTMINDSEKIPLVLSFKSFNIMETGSETHHKLSFEFRINIFRIINNKRYQIYESGGKPEMDIRGPLPEANERNIIQSVRKAIEGFNSWLNQNPDHSLLVKKVQVFFDHNSRSHSADTILWEENRMLRWADFKGKPSSTPFMAQSNCLFTYRAEPVVKSGILELHISMYAGFDKNSSWVKAGQEKDSLLAHEQLHFDICELHMRFLRKKINDTMFDIMEFETQINSLFSEVWNDYQAEQEKYDEETRHGINYAEQSRWEKDVNDRLKNVPEYP